MMNGDSWWKKGLFAVNWCVHGAGLEGQKRVALFVFEN